MSTSAQIDIQCEYTELVPIGELKPHPKNPNKHRETQIALLSDLILSIGWRFPIVVSRLSGYMIAGHARLEAGKRLGMDTVPVDYQDFASEADEITQLLADNRIPEMAFREEELERELLAQLMKDNANLGLTGYSPKEIDAILKDNGEDPDLLVEQPIPSMELHPHEHYDYIVLVFKRDMDWMNALQVLGVHDVNYSNLAEKKKIGLGRVLDGALVLQKLLDAKSDPQPGPVADHNDA